MGWRETGSATRRSRKSTKALKKHRIYTGYKVMSEIMSSSDVILDKCRELEELLRRKYGAKGKSLGNLTSSAESKLPIIGTLSMRTLAEIRNKIIKERKQFPVGVNTYLRNIDLAYFEALSSEIINLIGDSDAIIQSHPPESMDILEKNCKFYFLIVNKHCNKAIDVSWDVNDDKIFEYDIHKSINQKWLLKEVDDGYVSLISAFSKKCLSVKDGSQDDWAEICQKEYTGDYSQHWKMTELDDGSYSIRARHSGKGLDAANHGLENSVNPIQWTAHEGDIQRWWIRLS